MADRTNRVCQRRDLSAAAFSLIEVVLALGVISFALIVIVGLLPIGLKSNHDSIEESQAVNLLQALIADRQTTGYTNNSPIYNLPALTAISSSISGNLYVMADGVTTNAQPALARYRVSYTIYPSNTVFPLATNYPPSGPLLPVYADLRISWPAAQTNQPTAIETLATFMRQ